MSELAPRQESILRAVVIEYVTTAEPIASESLVTKYEFGVKSATVRNELAALSDQGLLRQPHTSAGRIPSDLGYRYYVDNLLTHREPNAREKEQLTGATDDGEALQSLLRDTARTLSRVTHLLSVATTLRDAEVVVRNAVLSALGPSQALLVLILSNGHVENRMLELPVAVTLEQIGAANLELASALSGKSLRTVSKLKTPVTNTDTDRILTVVWTTLRSMARELTRGVLVTEGEEFFVSQPEFQRDIGLMTDLLQQLTDGDTLYDAIAAGESAENAEVVKIGHENRDERMQSMSVVRQAFFVGGREAGFIAVVGPTRLSYDRSIPLVNFTARALSESLGRFFG